MKNITEIKNIFNIEETIDLRNTLDAGQSFIWQDISKTGKIIFEGYFEDIKLHLEQKKTNICVTVFSEKYDANFINRLKKYLGEPLNKIQDFDVLLDDKIISPVIKKYPGLRILKQDPWEATIGFITSSCSNLPRIKKHMSQLRTVTGGIFPKPVDILYLGENDLRKLGFGFRSPYIINAANIILNENLSYDHLKKVPYKIALIELLKIHGVGRKIADCILAYSLDKSDSFPVDRHVLSGLVKWYGLPEKTNPVIASDFARKKFGHLSSYAQQYIFHRQRLASRALLWGGRHRSFAIDNDID
jgi:N-glycosylase/DNA lyase|tara:strand:- start:15693 stop:16598 length:906 start_codon:yes stop_codon:yes gene_type:complete